MRKTHPTLPNETEWLISDLIPKKIEKSLFSKKGCLVPKMENIFFMFIFDSKHPHQIRKSSFFENLDFWYFLGIKSEISR